MFSARVVFLSQVVNFSAVLFDSSCLLKHYSLLFPSVYLIGEERVYIPVFWLFVELIALCVLQPDFSCLIEVEILYGSDVWSVNIFFSEYLAKKIMTNFIECLIIIQKAGNISSGVHPYSVEQWHCRQILLLSF